MKKYLVILVALAFLASCKKSVMVSPGLIGKWEVRHKMGSILGFDSTFKAGNGQILQFKSDSNYIQYSKGKILTQGKFHVGTQDFPQPNSPVIFFNNSSYGEVMIMNGTKLQLGMDYDDGIEVDYEKISD